MGNLHALQRVFARPDDDFRLTQTDEFAELQAENSWLWEDQMPMVSETSFIRAYSAEIRGRILDFEFHWTALEDGISVARRNTNLYGGLNVRLSAVKDQKIEFHTDPESARPRMAWAQLSGIFEGGKKVTGVSIFQHQNNPDYPGDWVEYPELNWFQPTFPAADSRYAIRKGETLILRYRMWIHSDRVGVEKHREIWHEFNQSLPLSPER
jgi:hypothetical protein